MDQLDLVDIYRTFHPKRFFDMSVLRSFVTGLVPGHGAAVELCHKSFHKFKREPERVWLQSVRNLWRVFAGPHTWCE